MRRALAVICLVVLSSCARVTIDDIGLNEQVVKGGQAEIDAGHVVDVTWLPGIWLAGHRTTHGGVFARLPDVEIGDRVCVYSRCYTIVSRRFWSSQASPGWLGPLVLQTSLPGGVLLLVGV